MKIRGKWSTSSIPLLLGPLRPGVTVKFPFMGHIDQFKNYSYSIGPCEKNLSWNNYTKMQIYEYNEYDSLNSRHKITLDEQTWKDSLLLISLKKETTVNVFYSQLFRQNSPCLLNEPRICRFRKKKNKLLQK